MKKVILAVIFTVLLSNAYALPYKHSFGVNLGSINGFSYKGYVGSNLHFVVQADLYYQLSCSPKGSFYYNASYQPNEKYTNIASYNGTIEATNTQSVMASPSFMYQGKVKSWDAGTMNWYAGGSVALGFSWGGYYDELGNQSKFSPWLKMGLYGIAGLEFCFDKAPIVLGLDLKPGYANHSYMQMGDKATVSMATHTFDWGANLTLRYCIGK